ncbi:hypothetical protein [Flavobacterium capsici]|uniref:Uncharacterized protein n=1 Tax=Flavobacterium capsici TaxID=3075618 RepID=A0AA96F0S8_9FLAO|nr:MULTISPECIES: hypothetical protein [unclassified Flavobacterium]WNM20319.1 hypothetical protein RN608_06475 [Flavobacterium sp. PMR2A8]WNM21709.1 hypothetical protein RN605_13645 [Flavobacterium sp. PMTSA4]
MKAKLLNLGLIITSLMGYLQWGKGNSSFLFEAELEVIQKLFTNPQSAVHPFTLLPLLGQILLLFTLFQKQVSKTLTIIGLSCLSLLLALMFVIGLMTLN